MPNGQPPQQSPFRAFDATAGFSPADPDLPYNLDDESSRNALRSRIEQWLSDARGVHQQYWKEWDDCDDRLNSTRTPIGFTNDHLAALAAANDPKQLQKKVRVIRTFVNVNRTRPNHEGTIGEFVGIRRKLILNAVNPKDRNRAKVLQKRIEYIERTEMLPDEIYFPAMDGAWAKGLHWIGVTFNPFARGMRGRFDVSEINIRDLLVDPSSRGHFFGNKKYLIHRFKMPLDDAKKTMRRYRHFNPELLSSDNEYDEPYGRKDKRQYDEYATFYHVEFVEKVQTFYAADPTTGNISKISESLYDAMTANPTTAPYAFEGEEKDVYYIALYNSSQGVFHLQKNPFEDWTRIPLVNIYTDSRLYPLGDVQVYAALQDLLDSVVTVFLENAKRANRPIAEVDEDLWEEYQEAIEHALEFGGAAPGIKNVHTNQTINSHLVMLIPWVMGWIQDTVSKHSATTGQLPAKQIAKETVQLMIQRDRVAHGRKDVTLRWTLTKLVRLLAKGITVFDKDPDFISLTDASPGEIAYIPINQAWTEAEYLTQLANMAGIEVPVQPPLDKIPEEARQRIIERYQQQLLVFEEQMYRVRQQFEQENDVQVVQQEGYLINGKEYTDDDVISMLEQSGLSWEEFTSLYPTERAQISVYLVNDLHEDLEYNIEYTVDADYQNDPEFKTNRALILNERQLMGGLDTLKEMNLPDAEGIWRRKLQESEALQIAEAIAMNPELKEKFVELVNQTSNAVVSKRSNGEKEKA